MKKAIAILLVLMSLTIHVNAEELIVKYKDGSYRLVDNGYCILSNYDNIDYVQSNFQYSICSTNNQWVLDTMNYEPSMGNKEPVSIAVIDTGINIKLEYFKGKLQKGYNAIDDSDNIEDNNGHGTHIAGIISSMGNANILPIKALDDNGNGQSITVANAIKYAVEHEVKVINLSLGGRNYDRLLEEIIQYALDNGCLVIASAGNTYGEAVIYPACFDGVLSVGAIDREGNVCKFSNRGDAVDVYAGGEKIVSILPNGEFEEKSGTSQACAFVSGAVCSLDNIDIEKIKENKTFTIK